MSFKHLQSLKALVALKGQVPVNLSPGEKPENGYIVYAGSFETFPCLDGAHQFIYLKNKANLLEMFTRSPKTEPNHG